MDKLQQLQNNLDELRDYMMKPIVDEVNPLRGRVITIAMNYYEKIHKPFTELLKELGLNENPTDYIIDEGEEYDR